MSFTAYATDYYSNQALAVGETTMPRLNAPTGATLVSQQLQLSYWTASKSEPVINLGMNSAGTAATATPTYCAFGMYQVNSDGSLTLVASCANDTTLFAATFTEYIRPNITPFNKQVGTRYAFGVLVVSAVAMPNLVGYNGTVVAAPKAPTLCKTVVGQSVLPASIAAGSLAGSSSFYYGEIFPV